MTMLHTFVPFSDDISEGFDDDYPWLVLKVGGVRYIDLLDASTRHLHLHVADPGVATARFADVDYDRTFPRRRVIIEGVDSGQTVVEAKTGYGHVRARLLVSCYRERAVKVNFYRVEDENGDVPIFNSSMVPEVIMGLNVIYWHQAYLTFSSHLIKEFVRVPAVLVERTRSEDQSREIFQALHDKAHELDPAPRHYHVFWVRQYGAFDKPGRNVLGEAEKIPSRVCIVEDVDDPVEQLQIVAHELGHCLGAHHDKAHRRALMYPHASDGKNRKLYKKTVEEIRGAA
jgi:hypothetical protein